MNYFQDLFGVLGLRRKIIRKVVQNSDSTISAIVSASIGLLLFGIAQDGIITGILFGAATLSLFVLVLWCALRILTPAIRILHLLRVLGYASVLLGTFLLRQILPFQLQELIFWLTILWWFSICVVGIKETAKTSWIKATIAVFAATIVFCILMIPLYGIILFSAAALGGSPFSR